MTTYDHRRTYRHHYEPPPCICGCPRTFHDMDTGECWYCGCEMLYEAPS